MHERLIIDGKGTERDVPTLNETIISKPQHQFGLTTFSQYIDKAEQMAEFVRGESLWTDEVKIDIKTPYKWFGVQAWGDFHIGSHGCDYDKLKELLAGVRSHDNLKVITVGNFGDFFTPRGSPPEGILGDVFTPQTQLVAIKKFLTEYQDYILSSVNEPEHADWVYRSSGLDIYEFLGRELNIPLVNAGGITTLDFGEVKYDLMTFHKIAKFKSDLNLTHGHKRALQLHKDADVVIAGHVHKPDFEWAFNNDHEVSLVQIGTLETKETGSTYGKKAGFLNPVRSFFPIILFNTEEKMMSIVPDLKRAEPYLCIK